VIFGLMWMWKSGPNRGAQTFTVKVRELVARYMYAGRFATYAPNSDLLRSVERQINCIANSRIHTDRWWDHKLKSRQEVNVAIISDVQVLDEGGRHRPRTLQVTWGQAFWDSLVRQYTKPIDPRIVRNLRNPLDLQLYRLLDRQLAKKARQHYSDIVWFARYKIGMRGKVLDEGGRTASSYVAKKLGDSLRRLRQEQFAVRMTIDRASEPFSVTFERIASPKPGQAHEVRDQDPPEELILTFVTLAHGDPGDQRRMRIPEADRRVAREWLRTYGLEKAKWMVERCVKMQRERRAQPILLFRGLQLYESAAAGAYEQRQVGEGERLRRRVADEMDDLWSLYRRKLIELFDSKASPDELAQLELEKLEEIRREIGDKPAYILDAHVRGRLGAEKCARLNALPESDFRAHADVSVLRKVIVERHGVDLLLLDRLSASDDSSAPSAAAA